MKKILNGALLVTFVLTCLVSLTGLHLHKLASVLFLLLCLVHTIVYRKKLGAKRWLLLGLTVLAFASGLLGMIWDRYPFILATHKALSIILVFFLAIHIFVFHKKFR